MLGTVLPMDAWRLLTTLHNAIKGFKLGREISNLDQQMAEASLESLIIILHYRYLACKVPQSEPEACTLPHRAEAKSGTIPNSPIQREHHRPLRRTEKAPRP